MEHFLHGGKLWKVCATCSSVSHSPQRPKELLGKHSARCAKQAGCAPRMDAGTVVSPWGSADLSEAASLTRAFLEPQSPHAEPAAALTTQPSSTKSHGTLWKLPLPQSLGPSTWSL